ncbi:MAG: hypothetical protein RhofKO_02820 [Rhodothermales bacterium]
MVKLACYALFGLLCSPAQATFFADAHRPNDRWERVVDLRGTWLFSLGDDEAWAEADYDDSEWDRMYVPARWEDEGYPGYDGFAWYRTTFDLPRGPYRKLVFRAGRIDDVDEVYINGHFLGKSGSMPPHYKTAYHHWREYTIPMDYLKPGGENVIAIRVFDERIEGGILEGQVGIYDDRNAPLMEVDLTGPWMFREGAHPEWDGEKTRDMEYMMAPGYWEHQGLRHYDGFATYHRTVTIPRSLRDEDLVLALGKIDDLDEVYLNGYLIGSTGRMHPEPHIRGDEWQIRRYYPIPEKAINYGRRNTLTVVVFDGMGDGGFHEGPIGIITHDEYEHLESGSVWDRIRNMFKDH